MTRPTEAVASLLARPPGPVTRDGVTLLPCLRADHVRHTFMWDGCPCRRAELPIEARAKSSGALGTPDRNHTCPDCKGLGEVSIYPCRRCLGSGELRADGSPPMTPRGREASR